MDVDHVSRGHLFSVPPAWGDRVALRGRTQVGDDNPGRIIDCGRLCTRTNACLRFFQGHRRKCDSAAQLRLFLLLLCGSRPFCGYILDVLGGLSNLRPWSILDDFAARHRIGDASRVSDIVRFGF